MTPTQKQAMRQALEALESPRHPHGWQGRTLADTEAAKALRAALAEPVAWRLKDEEASDHYYKPIYVYYDSADIRLDHPDAAKLTALLEPLYTSPRPPAVEPVAVVDANDDGYWAEILPDRGVKVGQLLYASPPPTADVPLLTHGEVWAIWNGEIGVDEMNKQDAFKFAGFIEALVRQKAGLV